MVISSENPQLKNNMRLSKPGTSGNSMPYIVLGQIYPVLGNLVRNYNINKTYVDKDDPWSGILTTAALGILSTENSLTYYILGQLLFERDIIIPIKNNLDWELPRQRK